MPRNPVLRPNHPVQRHRCNGLKCSQSPRCCPIPALPSNPSIAAASRTSSSKKPFPHLNGPELSCVVKDLQRFLLFTRWFCREISLNPSPSPLAFPLLSGRQPFEADGNWKCHQISNLQRAVNRNERICLKVAGAGATWGSLGTPQTASPKARLIQHFSGRVDKFLHLGDVPNRNLAITVSL